ncbi:MAG TPA: hypothetical protein VF735_17295 [Pyrinomonadaceae bacterium]
MKKISMARGVALLIALIAGLSVYGPGGARVVAQEAARPAQNRMVGVVTAIDASTGQVTIRTDEGMVVQITTDAKTALLRVPPGETDPAKAARITLAEMAVGDRLFARGTVTADGKAIAARQVVITNGAAVAQQQERDREAERRRRIVGRVTAINPQAREITVLVRSREGGEAVTVVAPDNVRLLRYAPDSLNPKDARPGTLSDVAVGDQLRAQGDRSADGKRFTAEEIISGAFQRVGGVITAINAATNEITVRNEQTGKSLTITLGPKSALRRLTPEVAATFGERRGRRGGDDARGGEARGGNATPSSQTARPDAQAANEGANAEGRGGRPGRAGGRNFQDRLENLPAITLADLKKGDMVLVNGTTAAADPSRLTAISLLTGEAEFLRRMQGGPNRDRQMNPGLPGDVLGGGTGTREQP